MARNRTLEAIISIAGQLDPSLAQTISDAQEQISDVQDEISETQKRFGGLEVCIAAVSAATVAATAALVKFGADAVSNAAAFETQMANVATLLDGKEEQVAARISELGDDVLAVSNSTGVATDELTDGLYQIISAVGDSEDGKGSKERETYLNASSCLHLKAYLDSRTDSNEALFVSARVPHTRLTVAGVEKMLRRIGKDAGVDKVHPHRFRRTMATNVLKKGMPLEEVKELLGHTKLDTTMIYCTVSRDNVKHSHQKLMSA